MPVSGKLALWSVVQHAFQYATLHWRYRGAFLGLFSGGAAGPAVEPDKVMSVAAFDSLPAEARLRLGEQGLFIIGSARSGTTVLQNALNESPEIFLFGEPDFHLDRDMPGFARRYNAMHRFYLNQETKSTFCPPALGEEASWGEHLLHMSRLYKYVGAKIVLNPGSEAHFDTLFDMHARYFYRAHYIFTFRKPLDAVSSIKALSDYTRSTRAEYRDRQATEYRMALITYICIMRLFIRMIRNFPFVRVAFHEDMPGDFFVDLENDLGVSLSRSGGYYSPAKVADYDLDRIPEVLRPALEVATEMYSVLRHEAKSGFEIAQINQNDNNVLEARWAPLGHTYRRSDLILASLRAM
jgi:hypothetical protein